MGKMICFDMDGTIADLYGVDNWLEKLRNFDPSPYRDAAPMWDMEQLNEVLLALMCEGWEIRVISWLSKESTPEYNKAVRQAKREWLAAHKFPVDKVHLVAYGTTKANCVRKVATAAVLVDDNEKVRNGWHLGDTIDPTEGNLLQKLESLLTA